MIGEGGSLTDMLLKWLALSVSLIAVLVLILGAIERWHRWTIHRWVKREFGAAERRTAALNTMRIMEKRQPRFLCECGHRVDDDHDPEGRCVHGCFTCRS